MNSSLLTREVFGFQLAVSTVDAVAQDLERIALTGDVAFCVAAADVHVIMRGIREHNYGNALFNMDLICPDGMPLVHLLNRHLVDSALRAKRVSGPDVMDAMMRDSVGERSLKHFFLGSQPDTLRKLRANFETKYEGCNIVGMFSPPFREWTQDDLSEMTAIIRASGANVVWVGLGCPKQELWMSRLKCELPPCVYLGVGAAFDFHANTVKRAPLWMQRHSLEWLYRIIKEPKRLLSRYIKYNSLFFFYLFTGKRATRRT